MWRDSYSKINVFFQGTWLGFVCECSCVVCMRMYYFVAVAMPQIGTFFICIWFAIQSTNLVSSIERIQWMPKGNFNWTRNHKMCSLQLTERRYECINSFVSIYCRRTFYMWMRNGVRVNLLNWHFTIGKIYSFFCLSLVILVSFKYYLS